MPHYTTAFSISDCTVEQSRDTERKREQKRGENMREIHLNLEQFDVDIAYSLTVPGPENGT